MKEFQLPPGWSCVRAPDPSDVHGFRGRYRRSDGAVVKYDDDTQHSNPSFNKSALMWTAWEPDPGERSLSMGRRGSPFKWPRRFHTPLAAMKAADRAWPPGEPVDLPR